MNEPCQFRLVDVQLDKVSVGTLPSASKLKNWNTFVVDTSVLGQWKLFAPEALRDIKLFVTQSQKQFYEELHVYLFASNVFGMYFFYCCVVTATWTTGFCCQHGPHSFS